MSRPGLLTLLRKQSIAAIMLVKKQGNVAGLHTLSTLTDILGHVLSQLQLALGSST